jgi:hypothetical protein
MKKIIFLSLALLTLSGCTSGRDISPIYPRINYRNSAYNFDPYNREIAVRDGFVLDEGHAYDIVETTEGYDVVMHFVELEVSHE